MPNSSANSDSSLQHDILDFAEVLRPEQTKLGSMNCPTCGKFARVVRIGNDSNPEMYYESWYAVVDCKTCGIGKNS